MAVSPRGRTENRGFGTEGDQDRALAVLSQLSEDLMRLPPDEFIKRLPDKVCQLLAVPICIIWQKVRDQPKLKIVAASKEVDEEYKKTELDLNHPGVNYIFQKNNVLFLPDISKSKYRLEDIEELKRKEWVSFLGKPLIINGNAVGIFDVFTKNTRHFTDWEKHLFKNLASYTNLAFDKMELIQEKDTIAEDKQKLQKLTDIMGKMSKASGEDQLWTSLVEGASDLTDSHYIAVDLLDHLKGELEIVKTNKINPDEINKKSIKFGQGVISKALTEEKTIIVLDVKDPEWQNIYVEHWQDTRSEMAIPLIINEVPIRVRSDVQLGAGSKRIGVLNLESNNSNAFSETDKQRLELLARYAAVIFDKLKSDEKLRKLREIEREIAQAKNSDQIIKTIIKGITDVLGFKWVNISLINARRTHIKSEYVAGLSTQLEANKFKQEAIHSLESDDIQSDIVRNKQIDVPDEGDERFAPTIFKKYGHQNYIRVFIPMIEPSSNQVIGTVEAGYLRKYRKHIYEQDVQILKSFVDYAVHAHALERRKTILIETFVHEFKSPIVGIRNNADYLQRKIKQLTQDYIDIKFQDIITNCGILFYHLGELEYILGASGSQKLNFSRTVVFRDIIIKTIYELQPVFSESKFSIANVTYNKADSNRIIVKTDKIKLNQVVYNLLINSIKYAESDPNKFKMVLEVDEDIKNFIIKFKDWGIGIKSEDCQKIFEEGFRSPEAIAKDVTGSGLGLTISKTIMIQLGGDLILANNAKPTEFHLIIPKTREVIHDSVR